MLIIIRVVLEFVIFDQFVIIRFDEYSRRPGLNTIYRYKLQFLYFIIIFNSFIFRVIFDLMKTIEDSNCNSWLNVGLWPTAAKSSNPNVVLFANHTSKSNKKGGQF